MAILSIILGFFLLIKGGDWLMKSSVALSLKLALSRMVIGMTVVSFATSAPELIVSIQAALTGHSDISLGNVIGSNIANLGFVLSIVVLITTININKTFYTTDWPMMIFSSIIFSIMIYYDSKISSFEGLILFIFLIVFIVYLINRKNSIDFVEDSSDEFQELSNIKIIFFLLIGGFSLWLGSDLLVKGSVNLAERIGISDRVIAITIVSIGTSIPELSASLVAIYKNEKAISLGNLIGSNIFNIMAVMGITAMIKPIKVIENGIITNDLIWMLIISFIILPLVFIKPKMKLGKLSGVILISIYLAFIYKVIV
ncbi:MAG: calcium/sodium antiporter [Flavobacteriaceae bacterium]